MQPLLRLCILFVFSLALAQNAPIEGVLSSESPQLDSGAFYTLYRYEARADEELFIQLDSEAFNAYLFIYDDDDVVLAEVDDAEGFGLNAFLTLTPERDGVLNIMVTTNAAGETGVYRLLIQPTGAPAAPSDAAAPLDPPVTDIPFVGTFGDGYITVQLEPTPEGFAGIVSFSDSTFTLTAHGTGGLLEGSFGDDVNLYPVIIGVEGEWLTFSFAEVTYRLARQE